MDGGVSIVDGVSVSGEKVMPEMGENPPRRINLLPGAAAWAAARKEAIMGMLRKM